MSKWKHSVVRIIQAFMGDSSTQWLGLGDDSKLYQWDRITGAWEKFWEEQDVPK